MLFAGVDPETAATRHILLDQKGRFRSAKALVKIMGYLMLALVVVAGNVKGYCGKRSADVIRNLADGMIQTFLRMALCIVIGGGIVLFTCPRFEMDTVTWIVSVVSGFVYSASILVWMFAVRGDSYLLVDVFNSVGGIAIPCVFGLVLGEVVGWVQYIGIAVMIAALIIMCGNKKVDKKVDKKAKPSFRSLLLVIGAGFFTGLIGVTEKYFVFYTELRGIECPSAVFSFLTFVFSALSLAVALPIICRCQHISLSCSVKEFPLKKLWLYMVIMAVCLFFHSYLSTLANTMIAETVLIYPLKYGVSMMVAAWMGTALFKDRFTWRSAVGMIMILGSIVMINVIGG